MNSSTFFLSSTGNIDCYIYGVINDSYSFDDFSLVCFECDYPKLFTHSYEGYKISREILDWANQMNISLTLFYVDDYILSLNSKTYEFNDLKYINCGPNKLCKRTRSLIGIKDANDALLFKLRWF